ncbi:MAG: alpha/beta hydrolase, partial [Flavobacteriales bacterium]
MNVYFISGLGANQNIFEYLRLPKGFNSYFIHWKQPLKKETLQNYTKRMVKEIDISEPFILVGLSFGGIVAQEMNRFVQPQKTILISSIKSREEMPKLFRFSSKIAAHKLIPIRFFTNDYFLSYALFRNLYYRKQKKTDLNHFFTYRDPHYLRWSIHQIVNWKPTVHVRNLY